MRHRRDRQRLGRFGSWSAFVVAAALWATGCPAWAAEEEEPFLAIDKVGAELATLLKKDKALVVWLIDASESLAEARPALAKKIDTLYKGFDKKGFLKTRRLQTVVAGFGGKTQFVVKQPIAKSNLVAGAVKEIEPDDSGVERIFTAVREAAENYRRFQTKGRLKMIVIVITDEAGDDVDAMDQAAAVLKSNDVTLHVLAPTATFNRQNVGATWTDPETKQRFGVAVNRGRSTREVELFNAPWSASGHSSGFAMYGLARLAVESGGSYFLLDDTRVNVPNYDRDLLSPYLPEYISADAYNKRLNDSKLRRTLMDVIEEGNALRWPNETLDEQRWRTQLDEALARCDNVSEFLDDAIEKLAELATDREKEESLRWQANYDLTLARLLQAKVRIAETNGVLTQFERRQPTLQNPKDNDGWRIAHVPELSVAQASQPAEQAGKQAEKSSKPSEKAKAPKDAKAAKAKEDEAKRAAEIVQAAEQAKELFKRIVKEHAKTPWAEAAARDVEVPLGARLEEFDYGPPPDPEQQRKRREVKVPKF